MSDDVALRVVDDRNRSRNLSRAPRSLGVRLQSFETRAGPSTGRPLICILMKFGCVWTCHEVRCCGCLQCLVFPMVQPDCASGVLGVANRNAVDFSWKYLRKSHRLEYKWYDGVGCKVGVCRCR